MCDLCDEYKRLAEYGRTVANERDAMVVKILNEGGEPEPLGIPIAPERPRCKDNR